MKKSTKAREFPQDVRIKIIRRDNGDCIFCKINYHMQSTTQMGYDIKDIMHYIPRSRGGLGIEENGAQWYPIGQDGSGYPARIHILMDNGETITYKRY